MYDFHFEKAGGCYPLLDGYHCCGILEVRHTKIGISRINKAVLDVVVFELQPTRLRYILCRVKYNCYSSCLFISVFASYSPI